jgi:hypothetical protein
VLPAAAEAWFGLLFRLLHVLLLLLLVLPLHLRQQEVQRFHFVYLQYCWLRFC